MKKIMSYHKIKNLRTADDYIAYYEKVGIHEFIEAMKVSGTLINPYDKKYTKEDFIMKIDDYLKSKNEPEIHMWETLVIESKIINELYSDLYNMELYKNAENVPKEKAFVSFVIILEKYLCYLSNEIMGDKEKNEELKFDFYSDFAYAGNKTDIEKYSDIYEHIVYVSDMILKYLLFYKCKDVRHDLETTEAYQKDSFSHLVIADQKSVIEKLEKEWRFFNRTISKNENKVESYCDSNEFLDFHIVTERLLSRRNKITNDIRIAQDATKIVSKEEGLNDDERSSIVYLKNVLAIDNLEYQCLIYKRNGKQYKVSLKDLVRAYAVIKQMVIRFIDEKQKFSNVISEVCLIIEENDIIGEFKKHGIMVDQAEILLTVLKYESYKDIFDTPLITFGNQIMLIPSMVQHIDIAQVVLSCVNQFNFEGKAFEKLIHEMLKENGIKATSRRYQDESGEYQCDVLFGIKRTLFVCECKAWGEPHSVTSYCERNEKCFDTYNQLNRIVQKYQQIKEELSQELGMKDGIIRIKKIVLLSNAVGIENMIDDIYFADYSTFNLFVERRKPTVNLYHDKTIYQYAIPGFSELEGAITENKLLKYISNSSAVQLMLKNTEKQVREMPMLNYTVKYDTYVLKEKDFLMPDKDIDEYLKNIENIYSLK